MSAFESLQAGERSFQSTGLGGFEAKHYLSGTTLVLVNLGQYDLAETKLIELEHLTSSPDYMCRIMFNRLNIALAEQNFQYSSEARLKEVTTYCEQANELLYLQFSQTIWHYFKFIDDGVDLGRVSEWLDNHHKNESQVLALNYPYLSSAYYATLAQGHHLLGEVAAAKKYAQTALTFVSLGNVIFKVSAMDVMIAVLEGEGDFHAAFELLKEKGAISASIMQ